MNKKEAIDLMRQGGEMTSSHVGNSFSTYTVYLNGKGGRMRSSTFDAVEKAFGGRTAFTARKRGIGPNYGFTLKKGDL